MVPIRNSASYSNLTLQSSFLISTVTSHVTGRFCYTVLAIFALYVISVMEGKSCILTMSLKELNILWLRVYALDQVGISSTGIISLISIWNIWVYISEKGNHKQLLITGYHNKFYYKSDVRQISIKTNWILLRDF